MVTYGSMVCRWGPLRRYMPPRRPNFRCPVSSRVSVWHSVLNFWWRKPALVAEFFWFFLICRVPFFCFITMVVALCKHIYPSFLFGRTTVFNGFCNPVSHVCQICKLFARVKHFHCHKKLQRDYQTTQNENETAQYSWRWNTWCASAITTPQALSVMTHLFLFID